ncbi:hypothetical protein HYR99_15350 [Candidatus Poribacteria bacterium]|nr:hypothetical protein [Candidatus Poribacteria bacterium]
MESIDAGAVTRRRPQLYRLFCCPRGINVAGKLRTLINLHSKTKKCAHLLLTGYRGDGKTTELFQLISTIQHQYRPLYFNAEDEFDLLDVKFPDFLLGITTAVSKRMDEEEHLPLPEGLIQDVGHWFATIVQTVERKTLAEITAEAGVGIPNLFKFVTAKLAGTIKAGGERREEVRKELNKSLASLIDKVDKLLSEAVNISRTADQKELVIIVDNLDRLHHELAFDLFHTYGQSLCQLNCHFIYVVPLSLLYRPEATLLPFENRITMPMIPVRNKAGQPDEANIAHLKRLLERRFVPDRIMTDPDALMNNLILSSGGHLRDLVRLFQDACLGATGEPDRKINQRIAQRVINELCVTYQNGVVEDDYEHLIKTYQMKAAENNPRTQRLIFNTVILVYDENGVPWQDVHPALANGEKFQRLLSGG